MEQLKAQIIQDIKIALTLNEGHLLDHVAKCVYHNIKPYLAPTNNSKGE